VLGFFREESDVLAREYEVLIDDLEWKRWYKRFIRLSKELFGTPQKDAPIEASRIIPQATPEMISGAVNRFMSGCPNI